MLFKYALGAFSIAVFDGQNWYYQRIKEMKPNIFDNLVIKFVNRDVNKEEYVYKFK